MTDDQFLIIQTLLDNKDRFLGENNLKDLLKDRISHKDYFAAFSPLYNNDFFTEDPLFNLSVSTTGLLKFNKEKERRIQADKDKEISLLLYARRMNNFNFISNWWLPTWINGHEYYF